MDINILIILMLLFKKASSEQKNTSLVKVTDFLNNMEINYKYTNEKIKLAKKIQHYIPYEYSNTYNKSILLTEKLINILETKELLSALKIEENEYKDLSNEERLKNIIQIIQEEKINSPVGILLDLVVNIDNYKNMYNLYSNMIKNKDSLNDPKFLLTMMDSLLVGKSDDQKDKMKDISKIIDIIKTLDLSAKNKPNEN